MSKNIFVIGFGKPFAMSFTYSALQRLDGTLRAPKGEWQFLDCQRFLRLFCHSISATTFINSPMSYEWRMEKAFLFLLSFLRKQESIPILTNHDPQKMYYSLV